MSTNQTSQCAKVGCEAARHQPKSGLQSPPFCYDHWWTCRKLDCQQLRDGDPTVEYCSQHRCRIPSCTTPLPPNAAASVLYCPYHKCNVTSRHCDGAGADWNAGRKYCEGHTCKASGCVNHVKKTTSSACSDHCCKAPSCGGIRESSREYCAQHPSCGKQGCGAFKNATDRFCPQHVHTCVHPSCFNKRTKRCFSYLVRRTFRTKEKFEMRYVEHCDLHNCAADGCNKMMDYGNSTRYCKEHTS